MNVDWFDQYSYYRNIKNYSPIQVFDRIIEETESKMIKTS